MARPADDRSLSPEEAELLLRLLRDPAARQRVGANLQRTVLNPDFWAQIGTTLTQTYLNPELWTALGKALMATYLNPEFWRRAAEEIAAAYSPDRLRALLPDIPRPAAETAQWPEVAEAGRALHVEVNEAQQEGPQPEPDKPLSWWLVTRHGRAQVSLLLAALTVLKAVEEATADVADGEIPEGLKDATTIALAIAAFLVLWLGHRYPDD